MDLEWPAERIAAIETDIAPYRKSFARTRFYLSQTSVLSLQIAALILLTFRMLPWFLKGLYFKYMEDEAIIIN